MKKKLEAITEEDVLNHKLSGKKRFFIFLKVIPMIFIAYIFSVWDYLTVLVRIPTDILDMVTLEEILTEITTGEK